MKVQEEIKEPTSSVFNPFRLLGGLVSDVAEGLQYAAVEIQEIPDALIDGWKNGAMIDTDYSHALKEKETQQPQEQEAPAPVAPTKEEIQAEIDRLTNMQETL